MRIVVWFMVGWFMETVGLVGRNGIGNGIVVRTSDSQS